MPPFAGVAVNVTFVPAQMFVALAAMTTDGVTGAFTVMVIVLDVAVGWVTQVSVEVITTVTASLLLSVAFWYVALFVPTLAPFNFH